ncbi:hypothetical protein UFOVP32_58 [uncultured Caudovirales phage]|uniref:Uncharacterized protein n=1 Tax=uncultured Caudovirales phage TaxID=2100421 RepID=A0A6J5KKG8_9CAUD|nr:hypothetical protein UFOVP32_58 [uncultured Caudovirales phage]CAB4123583.1 hypothetical protein UFOVP50_18 [uncultured Caudovirales phage]
MWVFLNDGFFSIVQPPQWKKESPAPKLLVRSRFKEDISRVFPRAAITKTPDRDYMYRSLIDREKVQEAFAAEIARIRYSNFKDSVPEDWRHNAYADVWGVMYREQGRQEKAATEQTAEPYDNTALAR